MEGKLGRRISPALFKERNAQELLDARRGEHLRTFSFHALSKHRANQEGVEETTEVVLKRESAMGRIARDTHWIASLRIAGVPASAILKAWEDVENFQTQFESGLHDELDLQ